MNNRERYVIIKEMKIFHLLFILSGEIMTDYKKLMNVFLDFGEAMMLAGAEISRTEDSIARMGMAYGAVKTNVFAITSSIESPVCSAIEATLLTVVSPMPLFGSLTILLRATPS